MRSLWSRSLLLALILASSQVQAAAPAKHPAAPSAARPKAPPAPARKLVWISCGYDRAQDGARHALTPAFAVEDQPGWTGEWAWVKRMEAETDSLRLSRLSCVKRDTREEAEADRQRAIDYYADLGGTVAFAPPPEARMAGSAGAAQPSHAPPAAGLTVKTDTSLRDAGKAWDAQVQKTLAAEAQKKVETAAKQVQADAKLKADYEAFFAERRKQGRAQ